MSDFFANKISLNQSGNNIVPIFQSTQYQHMPQQGALRQPASHKFITNQNGVIYRPVYYQTQIVHYERLIMVPDMFGQLKEGRIIPAKNIGEFMSQSFRTIGVQNRKLIQGLLQLGKQMQKN